MPPKLRLEYPGAIYHVMNRGDRREDIFRNDRDRQGFLATLGEACTKTGWQVHAYCLMRNHFHLVIETPRPNLVSGMKWLLGFIQSDSTSGISSADISSPDAIKPWQWMGAAADI